MYPSASSVAWRKPAGAPAFATFDCNPVTRSGHCLAGISAPAILATACAPVWRISGVGEPSVFHTCALMAVRVPASRASHFCCRSAFLVSSRASSAFFKIKPANRRTSGGFCSLASSLASPVRKPARLDSCAFLSCSSAAWRAPASALCVAVRMAVMSAIVGSIGPPFHSSVTPEPCAKQRRESGSRSRGAGRGTRAERDTAVGSARRQPLVAEGNVLCGSLWRCDEAGDG